MNRFRRSLPLLSSVLAFLLLFSACGSAGSGPTDADDSADSSDSSTVSFGAGTTAGDGRFTLYYDSGDPFNPLSSTSSYNCAVMSLVYEGLFRLDSSFRPQPVLCESYTANSDFTEYELTLRAGVKFHNGSVLTASDVEYSLDAARNSSKYGQRLDCISVVSAVSDSVVKITLSSSNSNLPALLDTPIIRSGADSASTPAGTGPYAFSAGSLELARFSGYRDDVSACPDKIFLKSRGTSNGMVADFSAGAVDLLLFDPTGTEELNIHVGCETRNYGTSQLQYVGFNAASPVFSHAEMRKAVACVVDHQTIADTVMKGFAVPAKTIFPSALWYYDEAWELKVDSVSREVSALYAALELDDADSDGWLGFPDSTITVKFIVSNTNSYRVAAAKKIAAALSGTGINTNLEILSWDDYTAALQAGDYDMYYAEVRLTADFDPYLLIGTGGSLNYGGFSDEALDALMVNYLSCSGDAQVKAAGNLCSALNEKAPIVPVVYKQLTVYTRRGDVTGLDPTPSGIFCNLPSVAIEPK